MPRAASSTKRQQGVAHQRNTQHENGLVGPGKRISKQKSQNQLIDGGSGGGGGGGGGGSGAGGRSGMGDGDDALSSARPPPPPLPPAANGFARDHNGSAGRDSLEGLRRASLGTNLESSSTESLGAPPLDFDATHRRIDVNAAKNLHVHRDPGPLDLAVTVLRSCPLADTIAILIILMQLSPIAISGIYMLFTLLTFVPPVTTSSGLSVTDIFEGTLGTPSLTTLVCMDVVVLLIWLFLWGPLQYLILDFAQVVIALTLGGGASSRRGSANNIIVCIGIVFFSHAGRYPHLQRLSRLAATLGLGGHDSPDVDDPLEPAVPQLGRRGAYSWIRNILAIHILTQGVVRYIREWYLWREKRDLITHSLAEADAGKPPFSADLSTEGVFGPLDADTLSSAANLSTKKKRKQSAQVRTRQPLWAALASTKIVMVKEYELSQAARESAGSEATDIDNLGNAKFHSDPRSIWICYVGHDEVCFSTGVFPEPEEPQENGHAENAYIDTSQPFYVKVNNARWHTTRILPIREGEGEGEAEAADAALGGRRWNGDIYALAPLSTYECEFVCTRTGTTIFFTSIRTAPAPSKDAEGATNAANQRRRHESPATTIRTSIATQETKLHDEKAKLKSLRKDNQRRINTLKKEIEKLSASAQSAGGNDEKLRQKIAQNLFQQKQAEQSVSALEDDLKEADALHADLVRQHRSKQSSWTAEKAQFEGARATFQSFKNSIGSELDELEEERAALQAKRTKIAARIAKAEADYARITDANARGLDEAERRRQERAALQAHIHNTEVAYKTQIRDLRAANEEKAKLVDALKGSVQSYLSNFNTETPYDENQGMPSHGAMQWGVPGPQHSVGSMWPSTAAPHGPPLFAGMPPVIPTQLQHMPAQHPPKTRGRSSSMLSDVSGFTQSSTPDDDLAAPAPHTNGPGRFVPGLHVGQVATLRGPPGLSLARTRGSSGSGSAFGSGSGSSVDSGAGSAGPGSTRDPTSPV